MLSELVVICDKLLRMSGSWDGVAGVLLGTRCCGERKDRDNSEFAKWTTLLIQMLCMYTHFHTLLIRKLTKVHSNPQTPTHTSTHAVMNTEEPVSFQTPLVVVYPTHEYDYSMPPLNGKSRLQTHKHQVDLQGYMHLLAPIPRHTNKQLLPHKFRMPAKLQDLCD